MDELKKGGLKIEGCKKHFVLDDNDHIPFNIRDQEADGDIILYFSDGSTLLFSGITESSSLFISNDLNKINEKFEFHNLSTNDFWKTKLNIEIVEINLVYNGNFICSVQFFLANNENFEISYFYETEYDLDTTVIRALGSG